MSVMASQINANLFVQQLIQAHNNEKHITGPLWGDSTSDQWIPLTKGQ